MRKGKEERKGEERKQMWEKMPEGGSLFLPSSLRLCILSSFYSFFPRMLLFFPFIRKD